MRLRTLVVAIVALLAIPTIAWANGPSGSSDTGQVKCKKGVATPVIVFYAGTNGLELCSSDNTPPDGRVIVSFSGKYVAADGDSSNPDQSSGFIRVDQSGPSCGDAKHKDASKRGGSCEPDAPPAP